MNEEPIEMKVKAVRQLVERAGYWKCTVTLTTPGGLHKDPTVDVDSNDVEKIPRLGDVLLVYPPRIVGYALRLGGSNSKAESNGHKSA